MQTRPTFKALAMELRFPCIKPMKLYVVDGNRSIGCSYKSDAKRGTLSEATKQAVVAGRWLSYRNDKQRRSQRPWN